MDGEREEGGRHGGRQAKLGWNGGNGEVASPGKGDMGIAGGKAMDGGGAPEPQGKKWKTSENANIFRNLTWTFCTPWEMRHLTAWAGRVERGWKPHSTEAAFPAGSYAKNFPIIGKPAVCPRGSGWAKKAGQGQGESLERRRSAASWGLALPRESFMIWPTRYMRAACLPAR